MVWRPETTILLFCMPGRLEWTRQATGSRVAAGRVSFCNYFAFCREWELRFFHLRSKVNLTTTQKLMICQTSEKRSWRVAYRSALVSCEKNRGKCHSKLPNELSVFSFVDFRRLSTVKLFVAFTRQGYMTSVGNCKVSSSHEPYKAKSKSHGANAGKKLAKNTCSTSEQRVQWS